MAVPLLFAAITLALTIDSPTARAADPAEETFMTADGVQLRGLFEKSEKNPGSDPVVILLYPPGQNNDMNKPGDWKGLSARLSKEGFNVFRFDWRGHGKSTDIKDTKKFWNLPAPNDVDQNPNPFTSPWNNGKMITGAPTRNSVKIKNELSFKDLKNPVAYAPTLLLDLAAARYHLDSKNDGGEVNTSSIYLIGTEQAATIGFAWLVSEWNRPASVPNPNQLAAPVIGAFPTYRYAFQPLNGGIINEAGADISGAVWISPLRATSVPQRTIQDWVSRGATKLRENNPMLFLVGDADAKGKKEAEFFFNEVLVANPPKKGALDKLDQTFLQEVKGGKTLVGSQLLGQATIKVEDTIVEYLKSRQKDRSKLIRKNRGFTAPWAIDLTGRFSGSGLGIAPP